MLQAGKEDEAQTDLLNACECYKKKRAWFSAAKALEQVITICLKKNHINSTENETKSAVMELSKKLSEQHPKTAAYKEQVGCKVASKEVWIFYLLYYSTTLLYRNIWYFTK